MECPADCSTFGCHVYLHDCFQDRKYYELYLNPETAASDHTQHAKLASMHGVDV